MATRPIPRYDLSLENDLIILFASDLHGDLLDEYLADEAIEGLLDLGEDDLVETWERSDNRKPMNEALAGRRGLRYVNGC